MRLFLLFQIESQENLFKKDKSILYYGSAVDFLLYKELEEGYLEDCDQANYMTPKVYYVDEKEAEDFDLSFKPMEKKKLDSQIFK